MFVQPVNLKKSNVSEKFVSKVLRLLLINHLLNVFVYEACIKHVVLITMYTTKILLKMACNVPNYQIFSKHDKSDIDPLDGWMSLFK